MQTRVIISDEAENDLLEIGRYIAKKSSLKKALEYMDFLEDRARSLADFPGKGRVYEPFPYRVLPVNSYLIFYRIEDDQVLIVRILHGARDIEALFQKFIRISDKEQAPK